MMVAEPAFHSHGSYSCAQGRHQPSDPGPRAPPHRGGPAPAPPLGRRPPAHLLHLPVARGRDGGWARLPLRLHPPARGHAAALPDELPVRIRRRRRLRGRELDGAVHGRRRPGDGHLRPVAARRHPRRHRSGGPGVLRPPGSGSRRCRSGAARRPPQQRRAAGRVDDHPAVREEHVPHQRPVGRAQGEGSRHLGEAREGGAQGGDPPALPQHHLLRSGCLRRRRSGTGVLREEGRGPQHGRRRLPRRAHPCAGARRRQPRSLRARCRGTARRGRSAPPVGARRDGRGGLPHGRRGRDRRRAAVHVQRRRGRAVLPAAAEAVHELR